jgi:hypothetical protein
MSIFTALCCVVGAMGGVSAVEPKVEVKEVVTRYFPANNGAGPLWCYGSTVRRETRMIRFLIDIYCLS